MKCRDSDLSPDITSAWMLLFDDRQRHISGSHPQETATGFWGSGYRLARRRQEVLTNLVTLVKLWTSMSAPAAAVDHSHPGEQKRAAEAPPSESPRPRCQPDTEAAYTMGGRRTFSDGGEPFGTNPHLYDGRGGGRASGFDSMNPYLMPFMPASPPTYHYGPSFPQQQRGGFVDSTFVSNRPPPGSWMAPQPSAAPSGPTSRSWQPDTSASSSEAASSDPSRGARGAQEALALIQLMQNVRAQASLAQQQQQQQQQGESVGREARMSPSPSSRLAESMRCDDDGRNKRERSPCEVAKGAGDDEAARAGGERGDEWVDCGHGSAASDDGKHEEVTRNSKKVRLDPTVFTPSMLSEFLEPPHDNQTFSNDLLSLTEENELLKTQITKLESLVSELQMKISMTRCSADAELLSKIDMDSVTFSTTLADPSQNDCPIVSVSQGFCDLTGYSPWEVCGINCRFMQCEETDREEVAKIARWIQNLTSATSVQMCDDLVVKILNVKKNGDQFWNLLHLSPMFIAKKLYIIGVQSDVTGRNVDPNICDHRDLVKRVVTRFFEARDPHAQLFI
ncbi:unnamed protein product [Vitrella brassicaformis CCMP3155]|uniref:PAS domain-containing protein n=1 Tax=Vitrella brassicaformis (strain CCMP3155) TaxID=1169540 RepID=A0A0G4GWZ3_VITBC|nr:unnamed protein product [Vitrella brassicaformis CCMP3155]|eukprot:CEM35433.1 unnamed protein product [Vitrella brassicaformis CCMP3155]